jgi:hypothetical protein
MSNLEFASGINLDLDRITRIDSMTSPPARIRGGAPYGGQRFWLQKLRG